ncbi:MAG: hypothetical protein K9J12_13895 [Melioribacteraceae bacterium]|nr:hypothetical protein [Melioribacteraceae bacterium]MCF8263143.1 hypothetical protein [Melioribacteraceae bacterium]MCF8430373.1 hypothetical protein [Melioribacteraceae bacterium]
MTVKSILDCERKNIKKLHKLQLPNYFKKVGYALFILSIVSMFINAFTVNDLMFREIVKLGMLIGLLLVSISKEEIEDELVKELRMQSYTFAFIAGVVFSLLMPFVDFIFDYFSSGNGAIVKDLGDWQILWLLLSIQVFYFEYLKKLHK